MASPRASHRIAARLSAAVRSAVPVLVEPLECRRMLAVDLHGSAGVILQSTGKPVVLDYDINNHAVLVRYFANSKVLDPSFGVAGEVDTNLDAITDIARAPGDKIVIVGSQAIVRFNANGSIDPTFNASVPRGEAITAVAV